MSGLRFFSRASDGSLTLLSYHPRTSPTWHWSASIVKSPICGRSWFVCLDRRRTHQWHDYLRLPFGKALCISRQDYHRWRA